MRRLVALLLLAGCAAPAAPPPARAPRATRVATLPAGVEAERITFNADGTRVAWLAKASDGDRVVLDGRAGPSFGFV